jgi:5-methylcytosine-specific restriction endonuclease McrA
MAQFWAEKFYRSKAWHDCRAAYIASKFGLCEACGAAGKIVHHIIELTPENINDPDITLNWDNLMLLCQDCHNKAHGDSYSSSAPGTFFDENGDLVTAEELKAKKKGPIRGP